MYIVWAFRLAAKLPGNFPSRCPPAGNHRGRKAGWRAAADCVRSISVDEMGTMVSTPEVKSNRSVPAVRVLRFALQARRGC